MRFKNGEEKTKFFEAIILPHIPLIQKVAAEFFPSSYDCEDLVQECLLIAWEKIDELYCLQAAPSWIYTIATRKAIDICADSEKRNEISIHETVGKTDGGRPCTLEEFLSAKMTDPADQAEINWMLGTAGNVLQSLPDKYKIQLYLRMYKGLSPEETERLLGIDDSTQRRHYHRAKTLLVRRLNSEIN